MMFNPISWFLRRRRAVKLGSGFTDTVTGALVWYWADPVTEDVWMATRRYGFFSVSKDENPSDVLHRLEQNQRTLEEFEDSDPVVVLSDWRER